MDHSTDGRAAAHFPAHFNCSLKTKSWTNISVKLIWQFFIQLVKFQPITAFHLPTHLQIKRPIIVFLFLLYQVNIYIFLFSKTFFSWGKVKVSLGAIYLRSSVKQPSKNISWSVRWSCWDSYCRSLACLVWWTLAGNWGGEDNALKWAQAALGCRTDE